MYTVHAVSRLPAPGHHMLPPGMPPYGSTAPPTSMAQATARAASELRAALTQPSKLRQEQLLQLQQQQQQQQPHSSPMQLQPVSQPSIMGQHRLPFMFSGEPPRTRSEAVMSQPQPMYDHAQAIATTFAQPVMRMQRPEMRVISCTAPTEAPGVNKPIPSQLYSQDIPAGAMPLPLPRMINIDGRLMIPTSHTAEYFAHQQGMIPPHLMAGVVPQPQPNIIQPHGLPLDHHPMKGHAAGSGRPPSPLPSPRPITPHVSHVTASLPSPGEQSVMQMQHLHAGMTGREMLSMQSEQPPDNMRMLLQVSRGFFSYWGSFIARPVYVELTLQGRPYRVG